MRSSPLLIHEYFLELIYSIRNQPASDVNNPEIYLKLFSKATSFTLAVVIIKILWTKSHEINEILNFVFSHQNSPLFKPIKKGKKLCHVMKNSQFSSHIKPARARMYLLTFSHSLEETSLSQATYNNRSCHH